MVSFGVEDVSRFVNLPYGLSTNGYVLRGLSLIQGSSTFGEDVSVTMVGPSNCVALTNTVSY